MPNPRRSNGPELFASLALATAAVALVGVVAYAFRDRPPAAAAAPVIDDGAPDTTTVIVDLDDGAVADPTSDPVEVVASAADAMAGVTSVEFFLERTGAPIFIDQFEAIALDELIGQFSVPNRAQAQLTVTVEGNLATKLGAIALDDEVWISNPVTGDFETLPEGYDIDPSRFFDPAGGWQPLLDGLFDIELIDIDDRGGERYHIRAMAPADEVRNITVGLVRDQDVPVELWVHPTTSLVTRAEFTTTIDGAESRWVLELDRFGDTFTIRPPTNVRS